MTAPQIIADLLILAFFAAHVVLRPRRVPAPRHDRGTALVFRGCYLVALLALNTTIPSPFLAAPAIIWLGVATAALGLVACIGAAIAAIRTKTGAPAARWRRADRLGNLALWIGATTASGNIIAALSVAVAMIAATGVGASEAAKRHVLNGPRLDQG